jgi:putative methyltransferase (TIGR04325 family)
MTLKDMIRLVTPPVFIHLAKRLRGNRSTGAYGLSGDYRSWDEAKAASTGYDSEIILEKTKAALLKVKNGEAVYERDSVLFDKVQYSWPLLAGLLHVAAHSGGRLNVLDFGGSLGSTYFQNRLFLRGLREVRWNIVEQPHYVKAGKEYFEDGQLKFYTSVNECLAESRPNVAVLSSVLQYLESPYGVLAALLQSPCDIVIIDRTPFWERERDKICMEVVHASVYDARIPTWVFSLEKFRGFMESHGSILADFEAIDHMSGCTFKGFLLRGVSRR